MKKLYSLFTIAMMAMMTVALTGCDDDNYIARTLEGTWEGNMYSSMYYNNRYYDATRTEVCFLKDPYRYSSGTGYWVDYYDRGYWGGYDYIANHIEWKVDLGVLHIYFVEDNYTVDIYNYDLDDNYFVGYIVADNGQRMRFNLRHVSSPNWNNYRWGYDDYYYDDYYYANGSSIIMKRPKAGDAQADTTQADSASDSNAAQRPQRVFRARE